MNQATFWQQVAAVRAGARADRVAAGYARGRRQRVITTLLDAAAAGDERHARQRMLFATARGWFVASAESSGRGSYAIGPQDLERIERGVEYIARRGAGRCMACGVSISNGSSFCRLHDGDRLLTEQVLRDLRWAFDRAAPAILGEPVDPT